MNDHFCKPLSMIIRGDTESCRHCAGETTPEEQAAAKREHRNGGIAQHYEIVRHRRLAHALTFYK